MSGFSDGREPHAGDLFTDREQHSTAFAASLAEVRRQLRRPPDPDSRRNVLVFYGVGGVGKTTLSERLEAWVHNDLPLINPWGPRPATRVAATVRVNLEGSGGNLDVTDAIVAIRQKLSAIKHNWPAFDLAFAAYWSAAHPGRPLPGEGTDSDHEFADTVREVARSLAEDVLGSGLVTAGLHSVRLVSKQVRDRYLRRTALAQFDGFPDLLDRCSLLPTPDDARPELLINLLPLLDLELRTLPGPPVVVIFVDTIERLSLDKRRTGERLLNEIVWSLPAALFVLTGRNVLDWADTRRTSLTHAGPMVWPGLVPGATADPRQHIVGNLSEDDTRALIVKARSRFDLAIANEVVEELVTASGGLPQYLDLARAVATTIKRNSGRAVTVADVTGSLGDLVERVLEDVPEDEQRALRAAALFPYFDAALVAAAAGVSHGCAERAVRRPMIDVRDDHRYPYRMHEEIRVALLSADHAVSGGWAEPDWVAAAERAITEARRRHDDAVQRGAGVDVLLALGLAIGLVCRFDVTLEPPTHGGTYSDWLTKAILFGPSPAGLRPYVPSTSATPYGRGILDFVLAKTLEVTPETSRELLRGVFDSAHPLSLPAGRHLAYRYRNDEMFDEALGVFDELVTRHPVQMHLYQRALTLVAARRFKDAVDAAAPLDDSRIARLGWFLRMAHGDFGPWLASRTEELKRLEEKGAVRETVEARAGTLMYSIIAGRWPDEAQVDDLLATSEAVGHSAAIRSALTARALMHPGDEDSLERLTALDAAATAGRITFRPALVRAAWAFAAGDSRSLQLVARRITGRGPVRNRAWIPVECLLDHAGVPLERPPTQWLEPYPAVRDRWVELFRAYRQKITGTRD